MKVETQHCGSYEDVKARIADFLEFLKKNYAGKPVAIVARKVPNSR